MRLNRIALPLRCLLAAGLAAAACGARADAPALDRPMDEATARAMLNRFGYGATPASLAAATGQTPRQYLMHALRDGSNLPPPVAAQIAAMPIAQPLDEVWARLGPGGSERSDRDDPQARKALQQEENRYAGAAIQARLLAMANADNQGHEALLSFWLNHFSIYAPKNVDKLLAWDYARAIEQAMAADSFEALLRASFYHPAMQVYLDNAQSTAADSAMARMAAARGRTLGVNENLARELMELHTLGVDGGYTQRDVQELARIITGAGVYVPRMNPRNLQRAGAIRQGLFLFDPRRHDFGDKMFLGQRFGAGQGIDEIDRALHLMATSPATAHHIAAKLARRFLADGPPPALVDAMARAFVASGGRISATLWPLLGSREFAASLARPGKFKEPIDYALSMARAVCGDTPVGNGRFLAASLLDMGEAPFMHTTPDGYGAGESDWLSPAAMAKRVRLAMGAAAQRLPFAAAADDDGAATPRRMGAMAENAVARLLQGRACAVNDAAIARLTGPLSDQAARAAADLSVREQVALRLAGPDFMRR